MSEHDSGVDSGNDDSNIEVFHNNPPDNDVGDDDEMINSDNDNDNNDEIVDRNNNLNLNLNAQNSNESIQPNYNQQQISESMNGDSPLILLPSTSKTFSNNNVSSIGQNISLPSCSTSTTTTVSSKSNVFDLCGMNFRLNQQDLHKLLNFYDDQQQHRQHNFIAKIKTKKLRQHHMTNQQYSINLQLEKCLRNASNNGNIDMIKQLLKQSSSNNNQRINININSCDERKRTALHFASVRGYLEIAKLLLLNGANPNLRDVVGNTPLHLAVCSSKLDIVILLLENGAYCQSSDNNGRTPINLAQSKLLYLSKSLEKRQRMKQSSSLDGEDNEQQQDSLLDKLKFELIKISIMLEIYFDKCRNNNNHNNEHRQHNNMNMLNSIKQSIEQSQTSLEIENDINTLLKCIKNWEL